jgi:hypothetical protein
MSKWNKQVIRAETWRHIGTVKNKLTLIDLVKKKDTPLIAVLKCECGSVVERLYKYFMKGRIISCGCVSKTIQLNASNVRLLRKQRLLLFSPGEDITGGVYNKLTVLYFCGVRLDSKGGKHSLWYCQCSCGNTCVKGIHGIKHSGHCGCGNYEAQRNRALALSAQRKNRILKYLKEDWSPRDDEDHKNRRLRGTIKTTLKAKFPDGCVVCNHKGSKNNQICAHHYKSHALYPYLRYLIANQVLLCEECHNELHKQLGWENVPVSIQVSYIQTMRQLRGDTCTIGP